MHYWKKYLEVMEKEIKGWCVVAVLPETMRGKNLQIFKIRKFEIERLPPLEWHVSGSGIIHNGGSGLALQGSWSWGWLLRQAAEPDQREVRMWGGDPQKREEHKGRCTRSSGWRVTVDECSLRQSPCQVQQRKGQRRSRTYRGRSGKLFRFQRDS